LGLDLCGTRTGIDKSATRFMVSNVQRRGEHTKLAATRCKCKAPNAPHAPPDPQLECSNQKAINRTPAETQAAEELKTQDSETQRPWGLFINAGETGLLVGCRCLGLGQLSLTFGEEESPSPSKPLFMWGVRYDMVWYGTWFGIIKRNS